MRDEPLPAWQVALAGAMTLSGVGILEWLFGRPDLPLGLAARSLLAVVAVHGGLGFVGGAIGALALRPRGSLANGLAVALLIPIPLLAVLFGTGLRGAAIGVAAVVGLFPFARRLLAPLPLSVGRIGFAHGALFALGVGLVATGSLEGRVPWAAVGVASCALLGIFWRPAVVPTAAAAAGLGVLLWQGLPDPEIGEAPAGAPSVLLVTLDTTRADRLGYEGWEPARTPGLDGLAERGRWFRNAQSLSSWTGPSHLTILTGRSPEGHGALLNGKPLPSDVPHLGAVLGDAGWETGAFVSGFPLQARPLGFHRAFHRYDDQFESPGLSAYGTTLPQRLHKWWTGDREKRWRRNAEDVNAQVLPWLESQGPEPFFAWVHYYDPHLPYEQLSVEGPTDGAWYPLSPAERNEFIASPEAMAHLSALYDEQLAYTDRHLSEVVDAAIRASGGNLWIVVTADHGESFGEHGYYFARDGYEVTGRVPMIWVAPEGQAFETGRDDRLVGSHDIAPTLLGALGLPVPDGVEGFDLFGDADVPERGLVKWHRPETPEQYGVVMSVRKGPYRWIERAPGWMGRRHAEGNAELYDLASDPAERRNLFGTGHPAEAELRPIVPDVAEGREEPGAGNDPKTLDPETREALEALGYLD